MGGDMPTKFTGEDGQPPVVFDAEPLVAYLADEPGSIAVEAYLNSAFSGEIAAFVNPVQLAEVSYVAKRLDGTEPANTFIHTILDRGVQLYSTDRAWSLAGRYKALGHSLGDSFALATANLVDGELLAGADDDFEDATMGVSVIRFRDEPA